MSTAGEYAIVYDLSDDRERTRVDKTLLGYGMRVQKSVFEARLTKTRLTRLQEALQALKLETGYVRVYRLLAGKKPVDIGPAPPDPDAEVAWIV